MSTTLGGVTLPDPFYNGEGHAIRGEDSARRFVMADGSLRQHYVGTRRKFTLRWRGLTDSQRTIIWNRYLDRSVQVYSPPESGTTYNVLVAPGSWQESSYILRDGSTRYDVSLALDEQQVV
ncbi:MAG TPA: hypothetical protein ENJ31_01600 [Anaerolineae bacterium]|nr:hypothetical protein [Anaerolineae bacterium]